MQPVQDRVSYWYQQLRRWAESGCYILERDLDRVGKCADSWIGRASVKKDEPDVRIYDPRLPDYLPELLPFHNHPDFINAPEAFRAAALSCAWIAYNEKTVAIESKIVSPACVHLIDGDVNGLDGPKLREAVSQALVDESYHTLLVVKATELTRKLRNLSALRLPQFQMVINLRRAQADHPEPWKKILIQLATAVVSEILVSDYLSLLSGATGIQPLNRVTTEIHRTDEAAHNGLFKSLGAMIYHALSRDEREFFVDALTQPSIWFSNPELDVWESMLNQIKFPSSDRIIHDCRQTQKECEVRLDLTTLEALFTDLGVEEKLQCRLLVP